VLLKLHFLDELKLKGNKILVIMSIYLMLFYNKVNYLLNLKKNGQRV